MVKVCEIGLFDGQIVMKIVEKSYSVVAIYGHPYIRYCLEREPHFIYMHFHTIFLKTSNSMNVNITVAKNRKTLRIISIIGRYNHN